VPGIDPIPVALAAGHGNCWFCSLTVPSLMLPADGPDVPREISAVRLSVLLAGTCRCRTGPR
jgi:hypothetical protein